MTIQPWLRIFVAGAALVFALLNGTWVIAGLVFAFILGLLVYRAAFGQPSVVSKQPSLTLCGPVAAPILVPAQAANQTGNITIANVAVTIASGTTLDNGGLVVGPPPQLCVAGELNGAGQLISGTLLSTTSADRRISYSGPLADLRLVPGQPAALSLSGLLIPVTPNASFGGGGQFSAQPTIRSLTVELNQQGQISRGTLTRAAIGDASRYFWLEVVYLALLLASALLYLYPETTPGATLSAKLSGPTSILLKNPAAAKLLTPMMLAPAATSVTPGKPSINATIPLNADITAGPSSSTAPIVISGETVLLSPDGEITLPDKTKATFNSKLPIAWQSLQSHATDNKTYTLQLVGPAIATFANKNTPAQISLGSQASSTLWDNFLLWMQDLRRWAHRTFPLSLGSIPLAIFWLGSLGSVVRGLSVATGTTDLTAYPWYYNSGYWHIARPIIGAAFALFTYLFFLSILNPKGSPSIAGGEYGIYLLAFVVGYSDGTFAALIERTINVLLGPGNPQGPHAGQ